MPTVCLCAPWWRLCVAALCTQHAHHNHHLIGQYLTNGECLHALMQHPHHISALRWDCVTLHTERDAVCACVFCSVLPLRVVSVLGSTPNLFINKRASCACVYMVRYSFERAHAARVHQRSLTCSLDDHVSARVCILHIRGPLNTQYNSLTI